MKALKLFSLIIPLAFASATPALGQPIKKPWVIMTAGGDKPHRRAILLDDTKKPGDITMPRYAMLAFIETPVNGSIRYQIFEHEYDCKAKTVALLSVTAYSTDGKVLFTEQRSKGPEPVATRPTEKIAYDYICEKGFLASVDQISDDVVGFAMELLNVLDKR